MIPRALLRNLRGGASGPLRVDSEKMFTRPRLLGILDSGNPTTPKGNLPE
jgi:hypothetical protein